MIYLDNAATTFPKPPSVTAEMTKCMREYCGNPGRSSHKLSLSAAVKIYECRCEACELFGCGEPENVVFTYNTTYALNMALKSCIEQGSHVLISDMEHNSVWRPVTEMERRGVITYDIFSTCNGVTDEIIADIKSKIKPETKAIACIHASNVSNTVLPIKEIGSICRDNGLIFIVDAAQSAGVYDIDTDEMHIDILCVPGHKGLYGPQGSAMMIFGEKFAKKPTLCKTIIEGGNGLNSLEDTMPDIFPERFEAGTLATPNIAGLSEGIKFVRKETVSAIREHEQELVAMLHESLADSERIIIYNNGSGGAGTFLFNVHGVSSSEVASHLSEKSICVRSGLHCSPLAHKTLGSLNGAVRVSFGIFNKKKDVKAVANEVHSIIKNHAVQDMDMSR
jgi:cysteine desulfurase family protein